MLFAFYHSGVVGETDGYVAVRLIHLAVDLQFKMRRVERPVSGHHFAGLTCNAALSVPKTSFYRPASFINHLTYCFRRWSDDRRILSGSDDPNRSSGWFLDPIN